MDRSTEGTSTSQPTTLTAAELGRAPVDESAVRSAFEQHAVDGLLAIDKAGELLVQLRLSPSEEELKRLVKACAADEHFLSADEVSALCILLSVQSPSAPSSPSKKFLTQRRQYMESGYLGHEAAFVSYVAKLEDHKQKCKQAGRYPEAHAAAVRLHELRTAEAERRRNDMLERHQAELQEVEQAFESERSQLNSMWEVRIKHIEAAFEKQVNALQEHHQSERQAFTAEHERRRPVRPKYSSDLLNKRKIEEYLAKQGEYTKAHVLKEAADCMESTEMVSTMAAFDAEQRLKQNKLLNKQQQELEALTQRGARGRAELEIHRLEETERRRQRYKNVVSELLNLQKLEVVHLDNFLESQAQAGKRDPLRESSFRRTAKIATF